PLGSRVCVCVCAEKVPPPPCRYTYVEKLARAMPKQITEIRQFLQIARRKDARSVKIKKNGTETKFKIRCASYLCSGLSWSSSCGRARPGPCSPTALLRAGAGVASRRPSCEPSSRFRNTREGVSALPDDEKF
ncbi:unnamed protein product, partial [Prorocentrum cordatum]